MRNLVQRANKRTESLGRRNDGSGRWNTADMVHIEGASAGKAAQELYDKVLAKWEAREEERAAASPSVFTQDAVDALGVYVSVVRVCLLVHVLVRVRTCRLDDP